MFKLLLTTVPLLASLVHAVPRPNIQQVAEFYNEQISPVQLSTTVSLPEATATAEPDVDFPLNLDGLEAIKDVLEDFPKSSDKNPTASEIPASTEVPSVSEEPSTTVGATISVAPSVTLEPEPSDDALTQLGKRAVASAIDEDNLANLINDVEKSHHTTDSNPEETPVVVAGDQSGAFSKGAAAIISKILNDGLPRSSHSKPDVNNPDSVDGSSLSAEPTTLSTVVGTPLASALPSATDEAAADATMSLLGKRDQAPPDSTAIAIAATGVATTFATVTATGGASPEVTAFAVPAAADPSAPVESEEPTSSALDTRAVGRRNVLYFTNWWVN